MSLIIRRGQATGMIFCIAGFILGCIAGSFISGYIGDAAADEISGAVLNYLASGVSLKTAMRACLGGMILSGLMLIAAFSVPGVFIVPAVAAAKGFAISCSVSALIHTMQTAQLWKTALILGTDAVFTLPFFFFLALKAFSASGELAMRGFGRRAGTSVYGGSFIAASLGCLAAEFAVKLALIMLFSKFIEF